MAATRKKTTTKTPISSDSLLVPNTWYVIGDKDCPPPQGDIWYLLHTVDIEACSQLYIAKWNVDLSVWLSACNEALQAEQVVIAFSPVFDKNGKLWEI